MLIACLARWKLGASVMLTLSGFAVQAQAANLEARRGIEAYVFVLPAIDCYRDTAWKYTIDSNALEHHLDKYTGMFKDEDAADLAQMKQAASVGAGKYDALVASGDRTAYCALVVDRYGPEGRVYKGLVVAKK